MTPTKRIKHHKKWYDSSSSNNNNNDGDYNDITEFVPHLLDSAISQPDTTAYHEPLEEDELLYSPKEKSTMELLLNSDASYAQDLGDSSQLATEGRYPNNDTAISMASPSSSPSDAYIPEEGLDTYVSRILGACSHGINVEHDFLLEIMTRGMEKSFACADSDCAVETNQIPLQPNTSGDTQNIVSISSSPSSAQLPSVLDLEANERGVEGFLLDSVDESTSSLSHLPSSLSLCGNAWDDVCSISSQGMQSLNQEYKNLRLSIDGNPPPEIRTRTPQEVRTFNLRASVTGYQSVSLLSDLRLRAELMYAAIPGIIDSIEKVPQGHKILGGNEDWTIEDPAEILLPGLTMCDTSARHREREFCLCISLFHVDEPEHVLALAYTTPFYTFSHRKVLERRKLGRGRLRDALDPKPHGMPDLPESPARWIRKKKRRGMHKTDTQEYTSGGVRKSLRLNQKAHGYQSSSQSSVASSGNDSDSSAISGKEDNSCPEDKKDVHERHPKRRRATTKLH